MELDKKRFAFIKTQEKPFDWNEFKAKCPEELTMTPGEWVMKLGILTAGTTMFPELPPEEAYQAFVGVINTGVPAHIEHNKAARVPRANVATRPCCGGGKVL